jgi:hypothetical protein
VSEIEEQRPGSLIASLRRHPVLTGTIMACTLVGAVLGFALLSQDWSALHRIAAGAVAGAGSAFVITATKMYG